MEWTLFWAYITGSVDQQLLRGSPGKVACRSSYLTFEDGRYARTSHVNFLVVPGPEGISGIPTRGSFDWPSSDFWAS
jgi:hypothetical protein